MNDNEEKLTPTEEQQAIISAAARGESFVVNAGAGTAKTTTLKMLAPGLIGQTLAVAFNKRIAEDLSAALPSGVVVKTLNGLGHSAWMKQRGGRLEVDKVKINRLVSKHFPKDIKTQDEDGSCWFAVKRFVLLLRNAGYVPPDSAFRPILKLVDDDELQEMLTEFEVLEPWDHEILRAELLLDICDRVLNDSIAEGFAKIIDFDDQIYLSTMFFCPYPHFPVVLVDESQDLSPMNHRQLLLCKPKQLIAVGDRRQAIYAFRGADAHSMDSLITKAASRGLFLGHYDLATSFRCPTEIVARQHKHYPEFRAAPGNRVGEIHYLASWEIKDIPLGSSVVICRNNAPLVSLAFALLRHRRGFTFFGQDMAKNLKSLIKKIVGLTGRTLNREHNAIPKDEILDKLGLWYEQERSALKARGRSELIAGLTDRKECARMIVTETENLGEAMALCDTIFESAGELVLTSGHRSKGFEWEHVFHLDHFRIPSNYAREALANGYGTPMEQETNLRYVIETRSKNTLTMLRLQDNLDAIPMILEEE